VSLYGAFLASRRGAKEWTMTDPRTAALAEALARVVVGHPEGKHQAPQEYDSLSAEDCRMPRCYAAAILAALDAAGWMLVEKPKEIPLSTAQLDWMDQHGRK